MSDEKNKKDVKPTGLAVPVIQISTFKPSQQVLDKALWGEAGQPPEAVKKPTK